jgi:hypothetical protein
MKRDWQQAKDEFSARLNRLQDQFDSLETLITSTVVEKRGPLPFHSCNPRFPDRRIS